MTQLPTSKHQGLVGSADVAERRAARQAERRVARAAAAGSPAVEAPPERPAAASTPARTPAKGAGPQGVPYAAAAGPGGAQPLPAAPAKLTGEPIEADVDEVRDYVADALADADDARHALLQAARYAETVNDVAAILAAREATGALPAGELFAALIEGMDKSDALRAADADTLELLADEAEAVGDVRRAGGLRALADGQANPDLNLAVYDELVSAIAGPEAQVERFLENARFAVQSPADQALIDAVTAATFPEHGARHDLEEAMAAHDAAAAAVAELDQAMMLGLETVAGMPEAVRESFITQFKQDHPEYAELDAARAAVAEAVAKNEDTIVATLGDQLPSGEARPELLVRALEVAAVAEQGPVGGLDLVSRITERIMAKGDAVSDWTIERLEGQVLPAIVAGHAQAAGDGGDGLLSFLASSLGKAIGAIQDVGGKYTKIKKAVDEAKKLAELFRKGEATAATVRDFGAKAGALAGIGKLGSALTAVSLVQGLTKFGDIEGWEDAVLTVAGVAKDATALIKTTGFALKNLSKTAWARISSGISTVVYAVKGIDAWEQDKVEAGVYFGLATLSAIATVFPPAKPIAFFADVAANFFLSSREPDKQRAMVNDTLAKLQNQGHFNQDVFEFLKSQPAGTYRAARERLGLTEGQIRDAVVPTLDHLGGENLAMLANLEHLPALVGDPPRPGAGTELMYYLMDGFDDAQRAEAIEALDNGFGYWQAALDPMGAATPVTLPSPEVFERIYPLVVRLWSPDYGHVVSTWRPTFDQPVGAPVFG